jgi:signal transduction histidine kinase
LGLPIARNILRAHGGDVVLRNRPEGGALAVATLPL